MVHEPLTLIREDIGKLLVARGRAPFDFRS